MSKITFKEPAQIYPIYGDADRLEITGINLETGEVFVQWVWDIEGRNPARRFAAQLGAADLVKEIDDAAQGS